MTTTEPGWTPDPNVVGRTRIVEFAEWLRATGRAELRDPTDYSALQQWSASHIGEFWQSVADYFAVEWTTPPQEALADDRMPGAVWFPGGTLNFGTHLLRAGRDDQTAVVLVGEDGSRGSISYADLRREVTSMAHRLRALGVQPGDRVVAYLPTCIEGVVAFVATALVGAVWAQAGLDYAAPAAADRLSPLTPKVLIAGSGYLWGGRVVDRREEVTRLQALLPTVTHTVEVATGGVPAHDGTATSAWDQPAGAGQAFEPFAAPFDHPLWVLFTSGTTGQPKGIVHGHGGVLLEQLVSPGLHMDLHADDVFFWYTTPNWMMWNAQVCGLLHGATIVLFDGRPTYPDVDALWQVAAELGVSIFGTSPGYLEASAKAGVEPGRDLDLSRLRLVGATGSVLPASANRWVREHVSAKVQLGSMSGGTDIVGIFVASAPTTPVYDGEISAVALGVRLEVWGPDGSALPPGEAGELVITAPMPSMPLFFWNDEGNRRLLDTYFSTYPGVWRQGDLITRTERGTIVIQGRSDATLNRNGIRLGSAEIYAAIGEVPDVADALVVGVELPDGAYWLPLFVVPVEEGVDRELLSATLRDHIARRASPRHVPDEIIYVSQLPRTKTGKRLEVPVKRILQGEDPDLVADRSAVDLPDALDQFAQFTRR